MSKRTSVRIPEELHAQLVERAARERRTVSNLIIALLSESFDKSKRLRQANDTARQVMEGDDVSS